MIRLPNTGTYSLELITAQNGAQSVVSYSDATSSAYTGGTQVASITSATTTTICSTPAASTVRDVDQINIKNTFAGSHTVTVQVDANGTNYPLIVAALLTDESLNYTHGSGWQCKDADGNTKNSALSAMTSAQLAAILTDETGSGAAVFANGPTLIAPILGTPASGTVTNLTGTASININGTVGATTPAAGTFTTLTASGLISANGGQIAFPATQNPSANANTLDDYEEGTWTPVLTFATPGDLSVTYAGQFAYYTKVGRNINVEFDLQTSAFTHTTASGAAQITGLPFAAASGGTVGGGAVIRVRGVTSAGYTHFGFETTGSQTYLSGTRSGSAVTPGSITAATMPTGGTVQFKATANYNA